MSAVYSLIPSRYLLLSVWLSGRGPGAFPQVSEVRVGRLDINVGVLGAQNSKKSEGTRLLTTRM